MYAVDSPAPPARQAPPGRPVPRSHGRRRRRSSTAAGRTPYLLAVPALILLIGLLGYPMGRMIVLSFQNMRLRELFQGLTPPWVGLDNYTRVLSDSMFWSVVLRTVIFTAVS